MAAAPPPLPFVPLNDLEALLVRAASDADQRPAFTRALLEAQLYAITPDAGPEGERIAPADTRISLVMVALEDGSAATAVFTAAERVAQVHGAGTHYIGMLGRDLLGMVAERPVLLNPGLSYGVLWGPEELAMLLGRPVSRTIEHETTVMLGTPSERPDDLIMRLAEAFHPERGVQAAWLALAQWPEQNEFAWYLDLRSDLPHDRLNTLLARALDGADLVGKHLDMRVSPPGGEPGAGIAVVEPR